MVPRVLGGVALGCALVVSPAGCGGDEKNDAKTVWAARVCDGVKRNAKRISLPTVDQRDARKSRAAILTFLGDMGGQLQAQAADLDAAGAPPVAGGKATYRATVTNLAKVRLELGHVSADLRRAQVTDMNSLAKALRSYQARMGAFASYQGPVKDLRANTELDEAFRKAPQCQGVGT
ncbi:hypothetical protein ABZ801_34955 [Actinomadura sp. NPDC047616]|uniref:hypothetical protein n=1 Tax=Actinomadura sp. NPDC047616 TaxID=3155914 RepID=UPI0033F7D8DA